MSSKWHRGDVAVCVLPVGDLELGCLYDVETVLSRGRYRRDGMMGKGLCLCSVTPPHGADGFDPRRFIRAASAGEAGTAETVEQGSVHEHATAAGGDAQNTPQ